ncbi:MAG: HD domain-containing protein [Candidatus Omnitrophica bacterium]|nr:HD domain-containing protein [Candidatus Omnitrophota bacterium]MBU1127716.1 HD domain-containing protein [Candidatus Omnitrophota bacterium]MBU1656615.1 HD domain-containing protein [Candidatus Omnitrophota bacterium]MBU1784123.1 HD domain-containing protein [Candidatus Omnitrophota bacterium]MBU1850805.1 HD domain-containing protein [Candidatus Omnitrophota bacterium]
MEKSRYFEYEKRVKDAYKNLEKSYLEVKDSYTEMIFRLALVAEHKDETTGTHLVRIADYSTEISRGLDLSESDIERIKYASPMHDIGKLIIPDEILKKPSGLTPEEREVMKQHAKLGADIFQGSHSPLLKAARDICLAHHERYDGTGYPEGLKGDEIPLYGKIVALADVFDALTSVRPYKKAFEFSDAVDLIKDQAGKHFDPKIVKAFLGRLDRIKEIWQATKDIEQFVAEKDM